MFRITCNIQIRRLYCKYYKKRRNVMQRKKIQIYGTKIMEDRVKQNLTRGQVHKAAAREQRKVSPRSGSNIENSSENDWFEEYTVESWCIGAGLDYRDYLVPSEQTSASELITVDISRTPTFGLVDGHFYVEFGFQIKKQEKNLPDEYKKEKDPALDNQNPYWPDVLRWFQRCFENQFDVPWSYNSKPKSAELSTASPQDVLDLSADVSSTDFTFVHASYLYGKPHFYDTNEEGAVIPMSVLWSVAPGLIVEPGAAAQVNAIEKGMLANQKLGRVGYPHGHFSKALEGQSQIREALNILAQKYRLNFRLAEIESPVIHEWPENWEWWKNGGDLAWLIPVLPPDIESLEKRVYRRHVLVLTSADTQAGSVNYLASGPGDKIEEEETKKNSY